MPISKTYLIIINLFLNLGLVIGKFFVVYMLKPNARN